MRVVTGCLRSTPSSFLPVLSGINPPETIRSASCLKLYTNAFNPKHLRHETLYLKPSPKRLRSSKPLRAFVELLSINGEPTAEIPPALQSFIPDFHDPQPPGCDLQRWLGSAQPPEDWCWPIYGQHETDGPVRLRCVRMWQGADGTPHLAWLHQTQTPVPHLWGRQPCSFGISCWIKVLTNMYFCSSIRKKLLTYGRSNLGKLR